MEDNSPPSPSRRRTVKPGAKAKPATRTAPGPSGERRARRSAAPAAPASAARIAPSNESSEPPPPAFDHLVAEDGFVRDFDRLASSNPKSAVTTALAVGVAVGFIAGLLIPRN